MSFLVAGIVVGGVQAATGVAKLIGGKKAKKKADRQAEQARREMRARQREYEQLDMSNPYADYQNQMAENVYEDLTVNQQQAEFEAQQGAQQRANIMQNMRGAAGGSGIAALAQVMANQGQLQAQRASASIGQQEAANERLSAQGQLTVQQGEQAAMDKRVQGEIMSREAQKQRIQTLMGMRQQEASAFSREAQIAQAQAMEGISDIAGGIGSVATSFTNMPAKSSAPQATADPKANQMVDVNSDGVPDYLQPQGDIYPTVGGGN